MKQLFTLILLCVALHSSSQSLYFPPVTGNTWDTVSAQSLGWCQDKLDTLINYVGQTNAKAFIILKDGKIVVEKYYGSFTKDSVWYWASAGKTMTAFLMGLAQEQGHLNINDSLPTYLGHGFSSCNPLVENKIKVIHQLTMTTGFDNTYGGSTFDNHCTADSCLVCIAAPGNRWAYHNAPYTITHWVLDSATHMNVNAYKNQNLLAKTGITGAFLPSGYDDVYFSKARAFARFGLLIQNHGIWGPDTIMHDATYFNNMVNTSQSLNPSYGYLWWLNGKSGYRLPGPQVLFTGDLEAHAPADMIAALGKDDQLLNIVPSKGLVIVRMGNPMYATAEVANYSNDSLWIRLNAVFCNPASVSSVSTPADVAFYPNPTTGHINISLPNKNLPFSISVTDPVGRTIATFYNQTDLDVSDQPSGLYYLHFRSGTLVLTEKVVKK